MTGARLVAVLAGAVAVGAIGSIGWAAIPSSDNLVTVCYRLSDTARENGTPLLIVDAEAGGTCKNGFATLTLNQKGVPGQNGADGADGVSVTSSQLASGDENCPTGGVALTAANGTTYVCNGEKGDQGEPGEQGDPGEPGTVGCELEERIKAALPAFALSETCEPGGGEEPPSTEVCNGLDDDGDGQVDEGLSQPVQNGVFACTNGSFTLTCNSGFASADGVPQNGCETNLMTSVLHCGAVGNNVTNAFPHATALCVAGVAAIGQCQPGWFNPDNQALNGCESTVSTCQPNTSATAFNLGILGTGQSTSRTGGICPGDENWLRVRLLESDSTCHSGSIFSTDEDYRATFGLSAGGVPAGANGNLVVEVRDQASGALLGTFPVGAGASITPIIVLDGSCLETDDYTLLVRVRGQTTTASNSYFVSIAFTPIVP